MAFTFPDPNVTPEFTGPNAITYSWDDNDKKWVVKTTGADGLYVKKAGDTMTGPLVMQDAELDFLVTGESLKDVNGDPVLDAGGDEQWDDSIDRFSHIESLPPRILRSDGTYGADISAPFGIRVEIDDGNTYRNRFAVGNRWGDAVVITGGTGPNVQFGSGFQGNQDPQTGDPHWETGEAGGTKITGIPTPTKENPDSSLAVNKGYVDARDELLRQDIIELEEEIDAIAPSLEYGTWEWEQPTSNLRAPEKGKFYLLDGSNQLTTEYKDTKIIVINNYEYDDPSDSDPVDIHTWADANPGELIQLFDAADPDFMLGKIVAVTPDTETGSSGLLEFVRIEIDLIQSSGVPNDNLDPITGKFLTRVNVFKEPSGGNASDFVLKTGDTMTGTLQMGKVTDSTPNSTASPKIKFEGKTASGSTNNAELYYLGSSNYLYTNNNFYASGTVQSHSYGGFGYAGDTRMGFGSKTVDNVSSTKYGYLGIGNSSNTRALEWSGSKGLQWLKANGGSGSQGQVLKKNRASGSGVESRPQWQGVVDISPSGSNRCVGELWYNSNDQVLYVRVS